MIRILKERVKFFGYLVYPVLFLAIYLSFAHLPTTQEASRRIPLSMSLPAVSRTVIKKVLAVETPEASWRLCD